MRSPEENVSAGFSASIREQDCRPAVHSRCGAEVLKKMSADFREDFEAKGRIRIGAESGEPTETVRTVALENELRCVVRAELEESIAINGRDSDQEAFGTETTALDSRSPSDAPRENYPLAWLV